MFFNEKISYGFGAEYKYDWGEYSTLTFTSQTKGHLKNFGIFSNAGYKFNENQSLSLHLRSDDHKETGGNQTYKINFTQLYKNFKFGLTHSTGLKNPSLYELYGSSSTHSGSRAIDPEKSKDAVKFKQISYDDVIAKKLKVMDSTAFTLSKENKLPIIVFNMNKAGNLKKIIKGEKVGTIVN